MNTLKDIIAVLASLSPLWAFLHPDFIPLAITVSPMGVRYLLEVSKEKNESKQDSQ